jgi:uncharacterized protein
MTTSSSLVAALFILTSPVWLIPQARAINNDNINPASLNRLIKNTPQIIKLSSQQNQESEDELFNDIVINRVEKLTKFLKAGGSPNRFLHSAVNAGAIDCVKLMLTRGANVNLVGQDGLTPVMVSARFTYRTSVKMTDLLISKGANVNAKASKGSTPLMFAASGVVASHYQDEYVKVVQLLIKHGAKVNVKNQMGNTPLSIAKNGKWQKIVEELTSAGAKS